MRKIKRKAHLRFALVCLAVMLCVGVLESANAQKKPRRPNVIFIMGDDQAAYPMGAYGNKLARTPNLDLLAQRGVRFDGAYCNSPVCTPSRQSIITGKLPHANGVGLLKTPLSEEQLTIADHLKQFGYRTGAVGKMHFNSDLKHGFDYRIDKETEYLPYLEKHPPRPVPEGVRVKGPWRPFKDPARIWLNADYLPVGRYDEDMLGTFLARKAVEFLEQDSEQPFCLWVSFYEPHSPFDFPVEYAGMYDPAQMPIPPVGSEDEKQIPLVFRDLNRKDKQGIVAAYYTSMAFQDKNVGLVLDALRKQGLEDNTLIVYVGDNGYNLGHHGRFEKHVFYEPAVRVPLFIRHPRFGGGKVIGELVELLDLMPTILDVTGVPHPAGLQGQSLVPLLTGKTRKGREYVFSEYLFEGEEAMIRTRRWKFIYTKGNRARGDGYETANPRPDKMRHLYDLTKDPREMTNLANRPEYKRTVRDMERKLYERLVSTQPAGFRVPSGLSQEQVIDLLLVAPEKRVPKENSNPETISIDINDRKPWHLKFGFNNNTTRILFPFDDPNFVEAIKGSGASIMRFPGGTIGNTYDSKLKIRYFRTTPQQADGAFARKFLPKAAKPRIF